MAFRLQAVCVVVCGLVLVPVNLQAGEFLGKAAHTWAKGLDSDNPEVRRTAAFALGKIGSDSEFYVRKLVDLVRNDRDPGAREAAAAAVGDIVAAAPGAGRTQWGTARSILQNALRDASPRLRRAAAYAIGSFGADGSDALPDLKAALRDATPAVRQNAAWAIGRIGKRDGDEAVAALCDVLRDDADPLVRRDAVTALGDIGQPAAAKAWDPLLNLIRAEGAKRSGGDDVLLRTALINFTLLSENQSQKVELILRPLTTNSNEPVATAAKNAMKQLGALGLPGAAVAREALVKRFNELTQQKEVPGTAVQKEIPAAAVVDLIKEFEDLGRRENGKVADRLGPLNDLLRSDDPETALLAAFALSRIGGPLARDAVPVLTRALNDPDAKIQEQAATFLGEIGSDAASAAPALADALHPGHAAPVRARAAVALAKIAPTDRAVLDRMVAGLRTPETPETRANLAHKLMAEVFSIIGYPANKVAMPDLLTLIGSDASPEFRHRCIGAFLNMTPADFPSLQSTNGTSAKNVMVGVLGDPQSMIRYDAARALAFNLGSEAPNKAAEVLLDWLRNKQTHVYQGTDATVTGLGPEGRSGDTAPNVRKGGDARYMAAQALGLMKQTAAAYPGVVEALREAARDGDDRLKAEANKALQAMGK